MEKITHKNEVENLLSKAQVEGKSTHLKIEEKHLGKFDCQIEISSDYAKVRRNYQNEGFRLDVPFWRRKPSIVMVFQLHGTTFYKDPYDPFVLNKQHHSLNYFNSYDCRNLLDHNQVQNDLTFILDEDFYSRIISDGTDETGSFLFEKVHNRKEFNTLNSNQRIDSGIYGILQNIVNCPYTGNFKKTYIDAQIKALFILQVFHFHALTTGKSLISEKDLKGKDKDVLNEVKKYLDENFLNDASIEGLSRQFGINEFKLKFGFKKLFSTSPMKYLQDKRMHFACQLLLETDETVAEISDKLGYSHSNNFSLAFRKKYGFTPQTYRNAN